MLLLELEELDELLDELLLDEELLDEEVDELEPLSSPSHDASRATAPLEASQANARRRSLMRAAISSRSCCRPRS